MTVAVKMINVDAIAMRSTIVKLTYRRLIILLSIACLVIIYFMIKIS